MDAPRSTEQIGLSSCLLHAATGIHRRTDGTRGSVAKPILTYARRQTIKTCTRAYSRVLRPRSNTATYIIKASQGGTTSTGNTNLQGPAVDMSR